jgi:hypothetical protein
VQVSSPTCIKTCRIERPGSCLLYLSGRGRRGGECRSESDERSQRLWRAPRTLAWDRCVAGGALGTRAPTGAIACRQTQWDLKGDWQ